MGSHDSGGAAAATAAIVVAAGSGVRMGADAPKALIPLAGRPMLAWSLAALAGLDAVVVAAPPGHLGEAEAVVAEALPGARVVAGGASRAESVAAGLAAL